MRRAQYNLSMNGIVLPQESALVGRASGILGLLWVVPTAVPPKPQSCFLQFQLPRTRIKWKVSEINNS